MWTMAINIGGMLLGTRWGKIALYAIPALASAWLSWWLTVNYYKADKLDALEKRVAFFVEQTAQMDALAMDYEQRKAQRATERVRYVEKDVYRDCKPDADWLLDTNRAIANGNATR